MAMEAKMPDMDMKQVLAEIKTLRDKVNDLPRPYTGSGEWINYVCQKLDEASDILEFPSEEQAAKWK